MQAGHVLVVDDEKLIRWSLRERLQREGYTVEEAADAAAARAILHDRSFDLALIDLRLPDANGLTLLLEAQRAQPELAVIIITAFSSIEGAVDALKSGASDYITKPFDMDDLAMTVKRTIENSAMRRLRSADLRKGKAQFSLDNMVGESPIFVEMKEIIRKAARGSATTVLLLGESGTGKDLAARAIHYESDRAPHPFMNITCTALPESLLESELFGFEEGAFTDASSKKQGLIELAHKGTVFMNEIGDMPHALQAKLLGVLEEKRFKHVGGTVDIHVDVRIIAATNRNLAQLVRENKFREDLFYRLNIVPIIMPALRDRREDIPRLARHFIQIYNREFQKEFEGLTAEAMNRLLEYPWPGNVRELRNVIERAVLLSSGRYIEANDIMLGRIQFGLAPAGEDGVVSLPPQGCTLAEAEKSLLQQALQRTHWNQTRTANLLGISRDQVRYKISKYGLEPPPLE